MGSKNKQSGFKIVGAVLVVAAVGIIGAASVFVYQHNKVQLTNAATNPSQALTTTPTTSTPAANQTAINIPELGIQITVPNDIKDLTYQVSTVTLRSGQIATLAMFSTKALTSADPACSAAAGPLGSLERVDAQYPTSDPNAAFYYGQLVQQFPTFYIAAGSPNAACSTNPNAVTNAAQHKSAFVSAESSIQASN